MKCRLDIETLRSPGAAREAVEALFFLVGQSELYKIVNGVLVENSLSNTSRIIIGGLKKP
jgi:hypothetical protein